MDTKELLERANEILAMINDKTIQPDLLKSLTGLTNAMSNLVIAEAEIRKAEGLEDIAKELQRIRLRL